jgi:hypothetical protein
MASMYEITSTKTNNPNKSIFLNDHTKFWMTSIIVKRDTLSVFELNPKWTLHYIIPMILAIQVKLHRTEQMRRKMGEIRIKSPKKLKKHYKNRSDWILYMFILLYYIIVLHPIHSTCRDFSSKLNWNHKKYYGSERVVI